MSKHVECGQYLVELIVIVLEEQPTMVTKISKAPFQDKKIMINNIIKRYIVKQGTSDQFCLPGSLMCSVNKRVKQQRIMLFKKNLKTKYRTLFKHFIGDAVFMFMQQLDLKRHVQSVPINSKSVSLNPAQNENLYLIPHQFDKVCQLLMTYLWFSPGTPVSCTNKADRHDITVILMKVVLSITLTHSLHHDQTVADRMQAL